MSASASSSAPTIVLDQGPVAYIASRYTQENINVKDVMKKNDPFDAQRWMNGVSLAPERVPFCTRCQLDTANFNPAEVPLARYETKIDVGGKRPLKGEYAECTPCCLWYSFFSEQRRVLQTEWQRVENLRLVEQKKREAEELKRKQQEEAELAAKQKVAKQKAARAAKEEKARAAAQ
jgi:hypothetical protein